MKRQLSKKSTILALVVFVSASFAVVAGEGDPPPTDQQPPCIPWGGTGTTTGDAADWLAAKIASIYTGVPVCDESRD